MCIQYALITDRHHNSMSKKRYSSCILPGYFAAWEDTIDELTSVAVIGGGLVGPLHAMLLAKKGFLVDLYEARQDIRQSSNVGDRSRSIALSVRGREALWIVGLEDTVLESQL